MRRILVVCLMLLTAQAFALDLPPWMPGGLITQVTDLPFQGVDGTTVLSDLNDYKDLVGNRSFGNFGGFLLKRSNGVTYLGCPGANPYSTTAQAVSNKAEVVGSCSFPDNTTRGYLYGGGDPKRPYILIQFGGSRHVEAHGVNDHRHVVGGYVPPNSVWHRGFWWSNGSWSTLDAPWAGRKATIAHAITNNQKITGIWIDSADNTRGFIRTNGSTYAMLDVPGARWTVPLDINEAGQVIGWYRGWDDSVGAFLYTNGQWYTVMVTEPNVTFTHIEGLNNHTHLAGRLRIWQPGATEEFVSKGLVLLPSPELQAEAPPAQVASRALMSVAAAEASTVPVYIPDWPKDYRPGKGKPLPW